MTFADLMVWVSVAAVCFGLVGWVLSWYRKVGPNRVLIVSGRKALYVNPITGEHVQKNFKIFHGGGTLVLPVRERVDVMSVELMTLEIRTPEFFTKFGVPIVVDGIAQIKVRSEDPIAVATAAEMFLSKSTGEMNEIAHQMMQGHLRAVISTLPFEEIHANPESFAQTVQRLTAEDLANMGIQVVSFTIREIQDPSDYLKAIGRPKLAEVQKNALIGEANADRDATMGRATAGREAAVTSAAARQQSELAQIAAEVAIMNSKAERDKRAHEIGQDVSEARAQSDLAYELQTKKTQQELLREDLLLKDLVIETKSRELVETVQKPAEAERLRIQTLAEAESSRVQMIAEAEALARRVLGEAEAEVTRKQALAEADGVRARALAEAEGLRAHLDAEAQGMREKAEAWQKYNSAAVAQLMIDRLPEIASAVAAPLSKVERIVLIGNGAGGAGVDRVTAGVAQVLEQVPSVVEAMTGLDLRKLMQQLPKFQNETPEPSAPKDPSAGTLNGGGAP